MQENHIRQSPEQQKSWWSRNKKKVFAVCGAAGVLVVGYLMCRNRKEIATLGREAWARARDLFAKAPKTVPPLVPDTGALKAVVSGDGPCETDHPIKLLPDLNKEINSGEAFPVKGHIRKLPPTWTPSLEARAKAHELKIPLGPHETFVQDYMKNIHVSECQEMHMEA